MSAARSDLCEVSPITQRSASTRFDLPQPLGPTTPVRPGSMRKSVASTKDLNPSSRSRVSFIPTKFQCYRGRPGRNRPGLRPRGWAEWCSARCRIARENESADMIPQQKEDVIPPGAEPAASRGRRYPLMLAESWKILDYSIG